MIWPNHWSAKRIRDGLWVVEGYTAERNSAGYWAVRRPDGTLVDQDPSLKYVQETIESDIAARAHDPLVHADTAAELTALAEQAEARAYLIGEIGDTLTGGTCSCAGASCHTVATVDAWKGMAQILRERAEKLQTPQGANRPAIG